MKSLFDIAEMHEGVLNVDEGDDGSNKHSNKRSKRDLLDPAETERLITALARLYE